MVKMKEKKKSIINEISSRKRAKKDLVIAYMKEIAITELVEEVKERIKKIKIDNVPESGYVEQLIEDNYLSPFTQVQNTERPDRVSAD